MTIAEANEPFVNGLKVIIAQKGLKNLYVAQQAGYNRQQLTDMLNGRKLIKACDIPRLAKALEVNVDDIYRAGKRSGANNDQEDRYGVTSNRVG